MKALAYTSIYQMTYLFLETVRGRLTNKVLNESFQPFIIDLNTAIVEQEKVVLEVVKDSINSYFEPMVDDQNDVKNFVSSFKETLNSLGLAENEDVVSFFVKTMDELLIDIIDGYAKADSLNEN